MIYWDPDPTLFTIPFLNWPILWYGLFFALGFFIGFSLFEQILLRYFLLAYRNNLMNRDLCKSERVAIAERHGASEDQNFEVKPPPRKANFSSSLDGNLQGRLHFLKDLALKVTDRITVYIVIATVVGARLGHFIFYERPSDYLKNPLEILQIWKGGLASHGAAIAIILAVCFFSRWAKKFDSGLTWIRLLDFLCVPTALAGSFIRIGNFFNQEILGKATSLPWGVVFGHPVDGALSIPRHPVQLYEALFYFAVFLILWRLTFQRNYLLHQGKLIGLFLILVFGFRFLVEFLKLEQSYLVSFSPLTMGQWLSVPLVILGIVFITRPFQKFLR